MHGQNHIKFDCTYFAEFQPDNGHSRFPPSYLSLFTISSKALPRQVTKLLEPAADQKRLESFEMWCWRRMKVIWTDRVRNKEVLLRVIHEIRKRKANWICHILRRNCLLKQVTEGKIKGEIEVTKKRRRRRRSKKLLDNLKDRRG